MDPSTTGAPWVIDTSPMATCGAAPRPCGAMAPFPAPKPPPPAPRPRTPSPPVPKPPTAPLPTAYTVSAGANNGCATREDATGPFASLSTTTKLVCDVSRR
jgi:hypothetical protein